MSCDWDVFCADCEEHHGFSDANHAELDMFDLIDNKDALAAFGRDFVHPRSMLFEVKCSWGWVNCEWFAKHAGHKLVARSEYGIVVETRSGLDAYYRGISA